MVIWAEPAKIDLKAIHDFISSDSKYYAKKAVQDIIDRTNTGVLACIFTLVRCYMRALTTGFFRAYVDVRERDNGEWCNKGLDLSCANNLEARLINIPSSSFLGEKRV